MEEESEDHGEDARMAPIEAALFLGDKVCLQQVVEVSCLALLRCFVFSIAG